MLKKKKKKEAAAVSRIYTSLSPAVSSHLDDLNCHSQDPLRVTCAVNIPHPRDPRDQPPAGSVTMATVRVAGSAEAANMERGSVPSSTLLRGSTTELEDEEESKAPRWSVVGPAIRGGAFSASRMLHRLEERPQSCRPVGRPGAFTKSPGYTS